MVDNNCIKESREKVCADVNFSWNRLTNKSQVSCGPIRKDMDRKISSDCLTSMSPLTQDLTPEFTEQPSSGGERETGGGQK